MKRVIVPLMAFALVSSHSALADERSLDAALARLNQSVQLGPVKATPLAVLKDERCVEDPFSTCPIASNAVVRLLVEQDGKVAWLDVGLGGMKRWGDHAIAVADIKPDRHNSSEIPPAAYQISLRRLPADVRIFE